MQLCIYRLQRFRLWVWKRGDTKQPTDPGLVYCVVPVHATEPPANSKTVSWGDRSIFFGSNVWRWDGCVGEAAQDIHPAAVCWAKASSPWTTRRPSRWGRVPGLRDAEERHVHPLSKSKHVHPQQQAWEREAACDCPVHSHMHRWPWLWSALLR